MVMIAKLAGPMMGAWNYMKYALGRDRDKRDFRAESELLNALRHADFNSHKYIISLFMKSGRTIVGRIGTESYDHDSYDKHRGTLIIIPERENPQGVSYELCEVRLSEIEGYLLQDVNRASPERIKKLREEAEAEHVVGGVPMDGGAH